MMRAKLDDAPPVSTGDWRRVPRGWLGAVRWRRLPWISAALALLCLIVAVGANVIAPADPLRMTLPDRLLPPAWESGGTPAHLLGTDAIGRDMLSRLLHGARVTLLVASVSLVLGGGLGSALGAAAGFFGGAADAFIMRMADATLAFPIILLALSITVVLGPSMETTVFAIALVVWARFARVVRGEVLGVKAREYVLMAQAIGARATRLMGVYILPNIVGPLIVLATLVWGNIILVESSLSFLGFGVPPPLPSWGRMLSDETRRYAEAAPWIAVFPGLAVSLTVFAFNMLGDALRDILDPRIRDVRTPQ